MSRPVRSAAILLVALAGSAAAQQRFTVGVQGVYADYRETSASLKFTGGGVGASFGFALHKFGADVSFASIKLTPVDSTATRGRAYTSTSGCPMATDWLWPLSSANGPGTDRSLSS